MSRKARTKSKRRQHAALKIPEYDVRPKSVALLAAIKAAVPEMEQLLGECDDHWGAEDLIYRFYYGSFKVFGLQDLTTRIAELLLALAPDERLNPWFEQIVVRGTGKVFRLEHNTRWLEETAPIVEAFFHARYFLEMAILYGRELEQPPSLLPSGWAAILCLYNAR